MMKIFRVFMFVSIFVLFLMAYSAWPGSKSIFVIFSFSFSALLYFAIKSYLSAGYLFLASALWIGYWLKLSPGVRLVVASKI